MKTAIDIDDLAQEIRRIDGGNSLGAGALAEALKPFLDRALGSVPVEWTEPNSGVTYSAAQLAELLQARDKFIVDQGLWSQFAAVAAPSQPDAEIDHPKIWLQNAVDAEHQDTGRMWCEDKVWPDDSEGGEPTEYVRADLYEAAEARVAALEAALTRLIETVDGAYPGNSWTVAALALVRVKP